MAGYCISACELAVDFGAVLDVVGFALVKFLSCLVVIESVGILGPGGDGDLDAG
jgi:hypothetical protein